MSHRSSQPSSHPDAQREESLLVAPASDASQTRRILIVDPSTANRRVLREILGSSEHEFLEVSSTSQAFLAMARDRIDLALVDLLTPELGGPAFCCVLRSHLESQLVPIILMTDAADSENEAIAISSGATDFLVKPFSPKVVKARVQSALRQKSMLDSIDQAEAVLFSLAQSVEARDPAVGQHCHRLALLSSTLGVGLGLPASDLIALQRGGFLHDIGKVAVPDHILFKTGPLTAEEWIVMRNHTTQGEQICAGMKSLQPVLPIIRNHHERWDGSGYPDGLRGDEIPLLARVLQLTDIFDALTSERPYKPAYSSESALRIIQEEARAGWRDRRLVEAFADVLPLFRAPAEVLNTSSLQALANSLQQQNHWPSNEHAKIPAKSLRQLPVADLA